MLNTICEKRTQKASSCTDSGRIEKKSEVAFVWPPGTSAINTPDGGGGECDVSGGMLWWIWLKKLGMQSNRYRY